MRFCTLSTASHRRSHSRSSTSSCLSTAVQLEVDSTRHTGRIYDRTGFSVPRSINRSVDRREESVYGLLAAKRVAANFDGRVRRRDHVVSPFEVNPHLIPTPIVESVTRGVAAPDFANTGLVWITVGRGF